MSLEEALNNGMQGRDICNRLHQLIETTEIGSTTIINLSYKLFKTVCEYRK